MVSLLSESFGNAIKTKGALKDNSKIKELIQIFVDNKINEFNKIYSLKSNLNFSELGTDLLTKMKKGKDVLYSLHKRGYTETSINDYNFENLNEILNYKYIEIIKKDKEVFIKTIQLNSKEQVKQYEFFNQDDYILFVPTISNSSVEYYYKINNYKIIDFKVDENFFVYLLVEKDDKQYLAISSLFKSFSTYNNDESTLNISECFNFIDLSKLPKKVISLEHIENNIYYFVDINNQIIEVCFCKKYYFIDDDYIYFNNQEDFDEFSNLFIETVQNNFLNMYNYLNFLGLNDFKINNRKISTKENNLFLEIFQNKFDNTLNGGLNYFNAKKIDSINISPEIKKRYNEEKDYHININDEYYSVKGNFIYKNYSKGEYKIEVTEDTVLLYLIKPDNILLLEKVKIPSYKEFYFCNLKFVFKKFEFPLKPYSILVSSNSPYIFRQSLVKNFKISSIPNNATVINNIIENSTSNLKIDINTNFDGRKIIFYNYFDWKKKRYKYGHLSKKLTNTDIIDVTKFKKFQCLSDNIIKENKLYSRDFGELYYTNTDNFNFELINSKGYITPFWINNQDKVVYFKNSENSVTVIDNKYECDFYTYIPSIENYIRNNYKVYSNVSVEVNDDLEFTVKNSNNLLMTNKFLNEPLFYKVYIEDDDLMNIHIFDNDNIEITEYIVDSFNNGYIFYFNIEKNKKYYYNTSSSQYNYFEPIESYKNIEFSYYFNEMGYIELNSPRRLKSFMLKTDNIIEKNASFSLFLYNTLDGTTNKISLSKTELNNKFEIDLEVDKIYLDIDITEYNKNIFYIVEDSDNSIITEDTVIYFKEDRKDVIYYSEKNIDIDIENIDLTKVKVDTYYKIDEIGNITKTSKGTFLIDSLAENEIAVVPNANYNNYVTTEVFLTESLNDASDDFYVKNFKMLGGYYINHDINSKKIAETNNIETATDEIFITANGGNNG